MHVIRGLSLQRLSEFEGKIVLHSTHKMNKIVNKLLFRKEQEDWGCVSKAPELVREPWDEIQTIQAIRDSCSSNGVSSFE